jgi:hypothetical protein
MTRLGHTAEAGDEFEESVDESPTCAREPIGAMTVDVAVRVDEPLDERHPLRHRSPKVGGRYVLAVIQPERTPSLRYAGYAEVPIVAVLSGDVSCVTERLNQPLPILCVTRDSS